jgi:hypothetical protein
MNRKSRAIACILVTCTFYWAFIRAIGSGWIGIGDATDLLRALGRVLFAFVIDPFTWTALTIACLLVFAHYPELRKRVSNGLMLVVNSVRRYKYHKLRIAVSTVFGILCILLIALWIRSLTWASTLQGVLGSERLQFTSEDGRLAVLIFPNIQSRNFPRRDWTITDGWSADTNHPQFQNWRLGKMRPKGVFAVVSWWFVVLILAMLAAAPWIRWRFSIRTLLIVTTLVAVVLGLIAMSL